MTVLLSKADVHFLQNPLLKTLPGGLPGVSPQHFKRMHIMKILTLNTHSLQEANYPQKLEWFIKSILEEKPDIIAMQEVNQTADRALMDVQMLEGQYPIFSNTKIRQDNHAAQVAYRLRQAGVECYWAWLPIKLGYGKYDEGVAILSLGRKIRCVDPFVISKVKDYQNWRTRAVLGVQVDGLDHWFYTVHMGWWDDAEEGFLDQWNTLCSCIAAKCFYRTVWLLGDFNAPDQVAGESYDHVVSCGWMDTYKMARWKDSGMTVSGVIDGWREKLTDQTAEGMRLDYIWCNQEKDVISSRVMFNGMKEPVVSDHYGVLIETKE